MQVILLFWAYIYPTKKGFPMKISTFILVFLMMSNCLFSAKRNQGMSKERLSRIRALFDQLKGSTQKKREMEQNYENDNYQEANNKEEYEDINYEVETVNFDLLEDVTVEEAQVQINRNKMKKQQSFEIKNGEMFYYVKPGESLLLIARRVYKKPEMYKKIMEWNSLKKAIIHPNQKLILKNIKSNIINQMKQIKIESEISLFPINKYSYKVYKVKKGDSLSSISKMFLGRASYFYNLSKFNKLDAQKYVYIGQKLIIPVKK
ncbi:MAG: hypothetical protein COB02_08485 [Candidatus Cloacimonadota bacterium]|nr:MAG: hypothetical protein COB02_08485 [Candidatus Cloacimonadota bacterium]